MAFRRLPRSGSQSRPPAINLPPLTLALLLAMAGVHIVLLLVPPGIERLVVTYFAFMESRLPQHRLGVIGLWRGTIDDPIAYLRSRGSSGAILGCHLLPPNLRARAKSEGRFCCLGPPNW